MSPYDPIEPVAADAGNRLNLLKKSSGAGQVTNEDEVSIWLYSIAISLKRIADDVQIVRERGSVL